MSYSPSFRGTVARGSVKALQSTYINNTGLTIAKGNPVCSDASGELALVNVSSDASVSSIVGLTSESVLNGETGNVIDAGRLTDITTSFSVGSAIYVSKTGTLTDSRPDIGVGGFLVGDYVVFVGVIVKNEENPSLKDIKLLLSVVGQL